MSLSCVCSLPSCRALTLGRICTGSVELRELVYWSSIRIDVDCQETLGTIFCCRQHRGSVCQIHGASRMVCLMVLYSHRGHFVSGLHSVIFDGD